MTCQRDADVFSAGSAYQTCLGRNLLLPNDIAKSQARAHGQCDPSAVADTIGRPPPNQLLVLLVLCSVCWGSQPLNALAVAAQLMLT
jgi:hypothetical protein